MPLKGWAAALRAKEGVDLLATVVGCAANEADVRYDDQSGLISSSQWAEQYAVVGGHRERFPGQILRALPSLAARCASSGARARHSQPLFGDQAAMDFAGTTIDGHADRLAVAQFDQTYAMTVSQ